MDDLDTTTVELEFLEEDYNDIDSNQILSTGENECETEFCDIADALKDDNQTVEECSSSRDSEKVNTKGKIYKKRKVSLEKYKIKTTLEIEKERIKQKSEELRLRALELKLKGEELRLKEMEMNKINYLTNIEEEKLKCFKDISTCLKELIEKNGIKGLRLSST